MKKWIHATEEISGLSKIDKIDLIVIANDARTMNVGSLPIVASSNGYSKDFDKFEPEEFLDVDKKDLRKIDSPIALDAICDAINNLDLDYKMTAKQQKILQKFYMDSNNSSVYFSKKDFDKLISMIAECKSITGPDFRPKQPKKNFAKSHDLKMVDSDYLNIVKQLDYDDFKRAIKSADMDRLGILLYEFITSPKGYRLEYSGQALPDNLKIYIKIIPNYASEYNITIISFHDADSETLADLTNNH